MSFKTSIPCFGNGILGNSKTSFALASGEHSEWPVPVAMKGQWRDHSGQRPLRAEAGWRWAEGVLSAHGFAHRCSQTVGLRRQEAGDGEWEWEGCRQVRRLLFCWAQLPPRAA